MQFLVYLTVLMVSVSTVLLEVHWLTSPPPQPKPAVQAAASVSSAAPKAEGPNTTLSPVYPKKADASPTQTDSAQQVQTAEDNGPRVIPGATVHPAPAQQPVASATSQSPAQPAQQPVASAAPQQPVQQSASQATTTAPVQKVAAETTGSASREEDTKPAASRINPPPETAASSNRCDVQACAGAYKSFRASDCTYQPFEGTRRVCEKPPAGRSAAREVSNESIQTRKVDRQPENRRYRELTFDRRSRQLSDDDEDDRADIDDVDDGPRMLFFGRRGRSW
jgi:hypothetical protein